MHLGRKIWSLQPSQSTSFQKQGSHFPHLTSADLRGATAKRFQFFEPGLLPYAML